MSLKAAWLGRESVDRIADVRMRCYGSGPAERAAFVDKTVADPVDDGDVLILSDETGDVATATSLSLVANVRGTELPCQGVAWVGTVRSHRRRRIDGRGLASRVMDAMADKARERGQPVSMLAPFRVSFYEAFGYGVVERQNTWEIPLDILPQDDTGGFAEYSKDDFDAALANRQRQFARTHGDVATDERRLKFWLSTLGTQGFRMVDRQGDRVASQFTLVTEMEAGRRIATAFRPYYESPEALRRILAMLGTLRDQYSAARITLPTSVPLNWWLRERQVPHRLVDHSAATCRQFTRMQAAVPDVPAVVAALRPTAGRAGVLTVAVGDRTWRIEVADGRATAAASTTAPDLLTDAQTWPALLFGDLSPAAAVDLGRLIVHRPDAVGLLAEVVAGPTPYCHEYF